MPKRAKFLIMMLLAGGVWTLAAAQGNEPVYGGKSLTFWLEKNGGLGSSDKVSHPGVRESTEAVRAIGTNAIPFLLKWIEYEPGTARNATHALAARVMPLEAFTKPGVQSALEGRGHAQANAACTGFLLLGRIAAPAIPELVRLSYRPRQSWTSTRATFALGNVGDTALPALEKILCDPKHPNRELAASAIGNMIDWGIDVSRAAPTLQRCLNDADASVASAAQKTLSMLPDPRTPAHGK